MARFGLLVLGKGIWNGNTIMHDTAYFNSMLRTSQNINPSYGYLWWLNGKSRYRLPGLQININGPLEPHAPADMVAALGKNGQILNVVPSMGLVMVRMGNAFQPTQDVSNVANDSMWMILNTVFCNTTSISSIVSAQLKVYPNPVTVAVSIDLPPGSYSMVVSDAVGKMMYAGRQLSGHLSLAVADWPEGIYSLRAVDESGRLYTSRLSVLH